MREPNINPALALVYAAIFWAIVFLLAHSATSCITKSYSAPVDLESSEQFEEAVNYKVAVVVMGADWCGYCKMLKPEVDALAKHYAGRIKVINVNTDKINPALLGYEVRGIPFVVVRADGKDVFAGNLEDLDHLNRIVAKQLGVK